MCRWSVYWGSMASIHVRIDDRQKKRFQKLLEQMGIDISAAFLMYVQYILRNRRLPFMPSTAPDEVVRTIPPEVERKWIEWEKEALREGKSYASAEEMHRDILGDDYAS